MPYPTKSPLLALILPLTLTNPLASAQSALSEAETGFQTLQTYYNQTSGLWNTAGWWNGANCMTAIADLAAIDNSVLSTAESVFSNTYNNAPAYNPVPGVEKTDVAGTPLTTYGPGWPIPLPFDLQTSAAPNASAWVDGAYDDDGWWALAWIAAYDLTNNQDYLQLAEGIFDHMTAAWPSNCSNGGIWWTYQHTYVNAIANELFLSVAAHLANRVPSNASYYISWAQREWAWFEASGMINADNNINDGLTASCTNNGQTVWSYNQGVILGGLIELNKAAPNASYLSTAGTIAQAAIQYLTVDGVLKESCDPDCSGGDSTQFKGVFMRNLQMLQAVAPNDLYVDTIQKSAASIWSNDRNATNYLSESWVGPFVPPGNASTQSSALDALVANAALAA